MPVTAVKLLREGSYNNTVRGTDKVDTYRVTYSGAMTDQEILDGAEASVPPVPSLNSGSPPVVARRLVRLSSTLARITVQRSTRTYWTGPATSVLSFARAAQTNGYVSLAVPRWRQGADGLWTLSWFSLDRLVLRQTFEGVVSTATFLPTDIQASIVAAAGKWATIKGIKAVLANWEVKEILPASAFYSMTFETPQRIPAFTASDISAGVATPALEPLDPGYFASEAASPGGTPTVTKFAYDKRYEAMSPAELAALGEFAGSFAV